MAKHPTAITGAAGEYFVAARLAAMGYVVALTRGGSPSVDLLVSNQSGSMTVSIQVKTAWWARRDHKRKKEKDRWEWPIRRYEAQDASPQFLYAFVDLRAWPDTGYTPLVFVMPSKEVKRRQFPESAHPYLWIMDAEANQYRENWEFIGFPSAPLEEG